MHIDDYWRHPIENVQEQQRVGFKNSPLNIAYGFMVHITGDDILMPNASHRTVCDDKLFRNGKKIFIFCHSISLDGCRTKSNFSLILAHIKIERLLRRGGRCELKIYPATQRLKISNDFLNDFSFHFAIEIN